MAAVSRCSMPGSIRLDGRPKAEATATALMIELRSWLLSNVFSPCLGPGLGTCLYSSHLCAFRNPVKHVMLVDLPGRSHFWVHDIQQMVEMQKKFVQKGDEINVVTHQHSGEQAEGGQKRAKLKANAGLGTNLGTSYSIIVLFIFS